MENDLYIEKLGRRSRRAALAGLIGILIFASSVVFSFYRLRPLQNQIRTMQAEVDGLQKRKRQLTEENTTLELNNKTLLQARDVAVHGGSTKQIEASPAERAVIFLHITNDAREKAQTIANALQKNGYIIPGIQKVSLDLTKTDIRFFHEQDRDKATEIAGALQKLGVTDTRPRSIPGYEAKVPPGQFEVWFSNSFE